VAWATFQPRTVSLAAALGGKPAFVSSRLGRAVPPLRYAAAALKTWRLLERESPELVLAVTPPVFAPLVCWLWGTRRRRPLVIDCHTGTLESTKWGWADPVHRWLMRRASATLLHTEQARGMVEGWGAPALLMPDDLPEATDATPLPAPARQTILVAGSFDENEPVEAVVEAARLLPEIELRLTGNPQLLPPGLRESAPSNAVFTGFLPYPVFLGELMRAHVVAAFSSDPGIMNRAAFEAVGLGRPLVLTDFPGLRERFGKAALLSTNEPGPMAEALRQALGDQEQLAERSRQLAIDLRGQRSRALSGLQSLIERGRNKARPAAGALPPRSRVPAVLMVTQHSPAEHVQVRRNLLELASRGFDVDVVCSRDTGVREPADLPPGIRIYEVPVRHKRKPAIRYPFEYTAFFLAALGIVSALALRRRYEVVQVDNVPDHLALVTPIARWRGVRVVFNMFELMPEMVASRYPTGALSGLVWVARGIEAAATRWADHVIVVSQDCWRRVHGRGVPASKLSVVLNTTPSPPGTLGRRTSPEPGTEEPPFLVTHGTLVDRYGVHIALQAFARLAGRRPGLTLRVIGDGDARPRLEELARELGIADRVLFTGYLPWAETIAQVQRAAAGIVSVIADGYGEVLLPTKLLEYTSLEVPTACARLRAVEDYFPEDSLAYFVPGESDDLADRLEELLGDPGLAATRARRAAEVSRRLGWDRMRDAYLNALGLSLDDSGAPGQAPAGQLSRA
jgi:glycosyltransferase involved in cell wall biosynthesis